MSDLALIAVILGTLFAVFQLWFMAWSIKVANASNKVNIPTWPGLLAVALFIAAVLL